MPSRKFLFFYLPSFTIQRLPLFFTQSENKNSALRSMNRPFFILLF